MPEDMTPNKPASSEKTPLQTGLFNDLFKDLVPPPPDAHKEPSDPKTAVPVDAPAPLPSSPSPKVSETLAPDTPSLSTTLSETLAPPPSSPSPIVSETLADAPQAQPDRPVAAAPSIHSAQTVSPRFEPAPARTDPANKPGRANKTWIDFLITASLTLLLTGMILFAPPLGWILPIQVVIGIIYLLAVPGYCLTVAFFPRLDDLDGLERAGLSLGLSLVLIPVQALVLSWLPFGLSLFSILAISISSTLLFLLIGVIQRWRLPAGQALHPALRSGPTGWWHSISKMDRLSYLVVIPILLLTAGVALWVLAAPVSEIPATEFFILGKDGLAQDYPREIDLGQTQAITIGITNNENQLRNFRVEVRSDDQLIGVAGPFTVQPGQTINAPVEFIPLQAGENIRIDILLFQGTDLDIYRSLQLWLKVNPLTASGSQP